MMGNSMMGWAWIWPVLVLIGVVLLGYVAVRLTQNRRESPPAQAGSSADVSSSARSILDERYARGEIDDEEYRRRRAELA